MVWSATALQLLSLLTFDASTNAAASFLSLAAILDVPSPEPIIFAANPTVVYLNIISWIASVTVCGEIYDLGIARS